MALDFQDRMQRLFDKDLSPEKFERLWRAMDGWQKSVTVFEAITRKLDTLTIAGIAKAGIQGVIGEKAYEVLRRINEVVGKLGEMVSYRAGKTFDQVTQTSGKALGGGLKAVASPVTAAGGLAAGAAAGPMAILGAIQSSFGAIASLVEHVDPAVVQQFEIVMSDLQAVMGQALEPILKAGIVLIRKLADTLETMRPAIDPIIDIIVKMMATIGGLVVPIAGLVVPLLSLVAQSVEITLVPALKAMVMVLNWVAKGITLLINYLIDAVNAIPGINIKKMNYGDLAPKNSQGKAIRGVNSQSAEELGAATRRAAFGANVDWAEKNAKETEKNGLTLERIKELLDSLGFFGKTVKGLMTTGGSGTN